MPNIKFKPLTIEEEKRKCNETPIPHIVKLKSKNKNLFCFGIKHSSDFSENQFKILDNLIKKVNIILIESSEPLKERDNERYYIISKNESKVPVEGCDLNFFKVLLLVSEKFDMKDILLLRALNYLNKKERKINLRSHIIEIFDLIKNEEFFSEIIKNEDITEKSFLVLLNNYLIKNNGKRIDEINEEDDIFPIPIENKTSLNEIIKEMSYIRDAYMLKKLREALQKFNNVLYVLGKNHIVRQERTIKEIFNSFNKD